MMPRSPFARTALLVSLLLLAGCDSSQPLALQNQSKETMTVGLSSKGGKCDLAKPASLGPSERLLVKCAAADLVSVTMTTPEAGECALTQADVARLVQEREGIKGSFLLPLAGC